MLCLLGNRTGANTHLNKYTVVHINVVFDSCIRMSFDVRQAFPFNPRGIDSRSGGILRVMGSHLLTKTKGRKSHVAFSSKT